MIGKVLLIGGVILTALGMVYTDLGQFAPAIGNTVTGITLIALVLYASTRRKTR